MIVCLFLLSLFSVNDSDAAIILNVPDNMGFEAPVSQDEVPFNWVCEESTGYECTVLKDNRRTGSQSAYLHSTYAFSIPFEEAFEIVEGYLERVIPFRYQGDTITLSGYFHLDPDWEVTYAGLYMILFKADGTTVNCDEILFKDLSPDSNWNFFSLELDNSILADSLDFGVILGGPGELVIDDLELTIDSLPLSQVSIRGETKALLDHEFDSGSMIEFSQLNSFQMESLEFLGKTWAFLKYHHPSVCNGEVNWDYELFRTLPAVIEAETEEQREHAILTLFSSLQTVVTSSESSEEEFEISMETDRSWMNEATLGDSLFAALEQVYAARHRGNSYYVTATPFTAFNEDGYPSMLLPDGGFRLLALYRYWGMVEYFFPYRYATNNYWSNQLRLSIPLFTGAESALEYQLALKRLIVSVGDTHAGIWNEPDALMNYFGNLFTPLKLRYMEDSFVVAGFMDSTSFESPIKIGDIIIECDGIPVRERAETLLPYTNGSTEWSRMHVLGSYLLRGRNETASLRMERNGQQFDVDLPRTPRSELNYSFSRGPAIGEGSFSLTEDNIGYINGAAIMTNEVPEMKEALMNSRGLIIDMRGYPSDFPLYDIADFIIPDSVVFTEITMCDFDNPGSTLWADPVYVGGGDSLTYAGSLAILISESSTSSSEFHTMAWRLAPEAMLFGHATSGADGNVVRIVLPGGIHTIFSGVGIYNPDRSETQRVGIIPDVEVLPTIEGIQAGRDEVLEAALEWLNSPGEETL